MPNIRTRQNSATVDILEEERHLTQTETVAILGAIHKLHVEDKFTIILVNMTKVKTINLESVKGFVEIMSQNQNLNLYFYGLSLDLTRRLKTMQASGVFLYTIYTTEQEALKKIFTRRT